MFDNMYVNRLIGDVRQQDRPFPYDDLAYADDVITEKAGIVNEMVTNIERTKREYKPNNRHDVRKVSPNFHSYINSVNVLTGHQGAGKTFTALAEALGVCRNTDNTKHLIFIKKKVYDPTFESVKDLFEKPLNVGGSDCTIIELNYNEAEPFMTQFFTAKYIFNAVKRFQYLKKTNQLEKMTYEEYQSFQALTDEDVKGALDMLGVEYINDYEWLNTIIIFDDVGNSGLFKHPDSFFNNRLKLCRDDNAIYFLTIHGITQLSPSIKENTMVVYVFAGLTANRLDVIFRQMNLPMDLGEFRGIYNGMLKSHKRYVWCDNNTEDYGIE
jgi:hypothetical protein